MVAPTTHPCPELSNLQQHILLVLVRDDAQIGTELKFTLEDERDTVLSSGQFYPVVNMLIEQGLVEKSEHTGRANHYTITDRGERLVYKYETWTMRHVGWPIPETTIYDEPKQCAEFTTDHWLADPPDGRLCFGFDCPYLDCEGTTPVLVDISDEIVSLVWCLFCWRRVKLDRTALEQFVEGVQTE